MTLRLLLVIVSDVYTKHKHITNQEDTSIMLFLTGDHYRRLKWKSIRSEVLGMDIKKKVLEVEDMLFIHVNWTISTGMAVGWIEAEYEREAELFGKRKIHMFFINTLCSTF